jgi:glycine cleavage system aminomethyltransferase T
VPVEHAALGTQLMMSVPDSGARTAKVVKKPFLDPHKEIPKS